ncbi:MAG: transporter, partial [Thermodesulfobacteriota bacterium]|nr:transporter [Thermodesulfobacteriota bacterium]
PIILRFLSTRVIKRESGFVANSLHKAFKKGRRPVFLFWFCVSLSLLPLCRAVEAAGSVRITPSISVKAEHDDNVDFDVTDARSRFRTIINPAFSFDYNKDTLNIILTANCKATNYWETSEDEDFSVTVDPGAALSYATELLAVKLTIDTETISYTDETGDDEKNKWKIDFSGGYQYSERLKIDLGLSEAMDTTLSSELEETGLVDTQGDRHRYEMSGGFSYQLSAVSNIDFSYNRKVTEYDSPGQTDYDSENILFSYGRRLSSRRDTLTIIPKYSRTDSDNTEMETYSLSLGWAHDFSPTLNLSVSLGRRYTETKYRLIRPEIVFLPASWPPIEVTYPQIEHLVQNQGVIGDISLRKIGELYSLAIGYNRDVSYSSRGLPIEVDKLYWQFGLEVSERLRAGLTGSYYYTRSEDETDEVDSVYFKLAPFLNYQVSRDSFLKFEYSYDNSLDYTLTDTDDDEATRHRFLATFSYVFPQE